MEGSVSFTQQPIVTRAHSQIYVWLTRIYVQLSSLSHIRWLLFFHRQFAQPKRTATHPTPIDILRGARLTVKQQHPFYIDAIVILPEHLHCLLTLAEGGWWLCKKLACDYKTIFQTNTADWIPLWYPHQTPHWFYPLPRNCCHTM